MNELERILMECRYMLSLKKSYGDLAKVFNVTKEVIMDDLNNKLMNYDLVLYNRMQKVLKKVNNYSKT